MLGVAICAPLQKYMEFDIRYAPVEAAHAIPAGVPLEHLDVLLPIDANRLPIRGLVRGFIKQEFPLPNGQETEEMYYPFGFEVPAPAAAAPVAPAAPAVPVVAIAPAAAAVPAAPAAEAVPAAPVKPSLAATGPAPKTGGDDDEEDD